ncbi:hypothetical protein QNO08_09145 [Arthrobacter sp. zg-Y820]|uniref:hypothetical protein n=1 Tax=unclassified Arthrobacter TaxID=235627 RepID=UPI001E62BE36|nr:MULTISPECIES: hypothetical protein [unclassified Arthrobacter]MCC9196718.1 hypothetical protein [Arthrobacter sp. zg-Y820]MDK1279580.1 hypothetical protein [Arthrobacter sp. zg.Y820]MDK1358798.1 hypothetical protein [Arthrobacter sp. zg-Y1219]WIB08048.1 hypothetical protein QNO08_09145 [Arthrobacter sp. zg-Y820]
MRRIGSLALVLGAAALLVVVGLTAAGRDAAVVVNLLLTCFWGALAVGLTVRLILAVARGQSVRRELRPVADAAAVYSELLTSTPPAAAEARKLPSPIGDDRESSAGHP